MKICLENFSILRYKKNLVAFADFLPDFNAYRVASVSLRDILMFDLHGVDYLREIRCRAFEMKIVANFYCRGKLHPCYVDFLKEIRDVSDFFL